MRISLSAAIDTILQALELTPAHLAQLIGASRQSIYRWRGGEEAEGLHAIMLFGLAEELRVASEPMLAAWRVQVARAVREEASLRTIRALVQRPASRSDRRQALETLGISAEKAPLLDLLAGDQNALRRSERRVETTYANPPRAGKPREIYGTMTPGGRPSTGYGPTPRKRTKDR